MAWTVWGSNPSKVKRFPLLQTTVHTCSWFHSASCSMGSTAPSWGPAHEVTPQQLLQRLRMSGSLPLLLLYAFMVWTGKIAPF